MLLLIRVIFLIMLSLVPLLTISVYVVWQEQDIGWAESCKEVSFNTEKEECLEKTGEAGKRAKDACFASRRNRAAKRQGGWYIRRCVQCILPRADCVERVKSVSQKNEL